MSNVNNSRAFRLAIRGLQNLILTKPLSISLEITHSCNCNCKHCDKGGNIPDEVLAPPKRFGDAVKELKPLVAQISGGEPLLRKDIEEIIKEVKYS
jgi:MoaA/NifB/PqqE/SkfB family radical SAM enzyme